MAWNETDLQKLKEKGFSVDENKPWRTEAKWMNQSEPMPKSQLVKALKKIEKISVEKNTIEFILMSFKQKGLISDFVAEHPFHNTRRWRFDWAILDLNISIEYEGVFSKKSRHTTVNGFSEDCNKYNSAQLLGWKVLRYTAINYQNLEEDLNQLLNRKDE